MKKILMSILICAATTGAGAHPGHGNHHGHKSHHNSHYTGHHSKHYKPHHVHHNCHGYGNKGYYGAVNYKPKPVYGYGTYIAPSGFSQLKYAVMSTHFDATRLQIAKQGIATNYTTSAQVLELMQCLDFESSRLELAKFAYGYTVDPQNYFIVNNGFDFNSSVASLNQYISRY